MDDQSLLDHLTGQLHRLCESIGMEPASASDLLADLVGPAGLRSVTLPPLWPSDVADDHTPIEFSVAFNHTEPPTLRILGEAMAASPSPAANFAAANAFVARQVARFGLSTAQLEQVRDVFATDDPLGKFALWHSLVFRHGRQPEFKVYFNPELQGVDRSPAIVAEAMDRLGLGASYRVMLDHGIRSGELSHSDRLTFFALDLHDGPHARVKLYLSHHNAQVSDVVRAAGVVPDIDADELYKFCEIAGGDTDVFSGRPLVGSYTFLGGGEVPAGYSVYVPIRSYVSHDEEAYDRVAMLLDRYGFDSTALDPIIAALAERKLRDGVGLIAHVSLRLGKPRGGITVYLSAEAYRAQPPRDAHQAAVAA